MTKEMTMVLFLTSKVTSLLVQTNTIQTSEPRKTNRHFGTYDVWLAKRLFLQPATSHHHHFDV